VPFPQEIALASRNPGKIREILDICADWPVRWITATDRPGSWPRVEETGESYLDNALLKAKAVAEAVGVPSLSDDSGIETTCTSSSQRSSEFRNPRARPGTDAWQRSRFPKAPPCGRREPAKAD
jgi:XTP/dITP diphosphohydrolase